MHAIGAFFNDARDFREAHFAAIIHFKRTASNETKVEDAKYDGLKERFVSIVEWAINEYVFVAHTGLHPLFSLEALADGSGYSSSDIRGPKIAFDPRLL